MSKHDQTKPLVSFRMPQELVDRMKSYCEKHGTDPSKFMRTLVETALLTPDERLQPMKDIEAEFNKTLDELQAKMKALGNPPVFILPPTPKGSPKKK